MLRGIKSECGRPALAVSGGRRILYALDVSQTPAIGPEQPRKPQIQVHRKLNKSISNRSQVCKRRAGRRRAIRRESQIERLGRRLFGVPR